MTDEATTLSRRESRKRRTREALHEAAVRLTLERGYNATTVADIAEAAGVSPRTFFGYFPSKEAALYAPLDDIVERFSEALATRPAEIDTFTLLRDWTADAAGALAAINAGATGTLQRLGLESDAVAAYGLRIMDQISAAVAASLRAELPPDVDEALSEIAAASIVSAVSAGMQVGHHQPREGDAAELLLRDVDRAIAFARAGIAAWEG